MDKSTAKFWCNNQAFDENHVVICLAHLAEARVFTCPYKSPSERLEAEYPCSDYWKPEQE